MTPTWLEPIVAACHQRLVDLPPTHPAHQLLRARGVGFAPGGAHKLGWLEDPSGIASCTPEFWGWVQRYGWNKIVFPLHDPFGHVIGLQLRSPTEKGYRDFLAVKPELCPPTFGLHIALPKAFETKRLVIVEGVFDYFAMLPYATETLAILTSNASLSLRRLFSRYVTTVVCVTDMDAPGRRGAHLLAGLPIPPEYATPKDVGRRIPATPPYHVVFPAYTEHDPSDLLAAGKHHELRRLAAVGLLGVQHR